MQHFLTPREIEEMEWNEKENDEQEERRASRLDRKTALLARLKNRSRDLTPDEAAVKDILREQIEEMELRAEQLRLRRWEARQRRLDDEGPVNAPNPGPVASGPPAVPF